MSNRDHLVPSMTVDRNGHAKTVYVSPSGSSRSSALSFSAPTLSRFEEQEDDHDEEDGLGPEWEGISSPESWEANEFSADDAMDWEYVGFDADDAYGWRAAEFSASEAKEWLDAGFGANDAKEWENAGYDSDDAHAWSSNDFTPDAASEWRNYFDSAEVAAGWSSNGFSVSEASEYFDAGFKDAGDASEWRDAIGKWKRIDASELFTLFEAKAESGDARQWLSLHETVQRVEEGSGESLEGLLETMNGVNPSAGDEYASWFPYSQWHLLAGAHIEFDKVRTVVSAKSLINEMRQDDEGDDYEDNEESDLTEALSWVGSAKSVDRPKERVILGLIRAGKSSSQYPVFLAHDKKMPYGENLEDIALAESWAVEDAGTNSPMKEKASRFEMFYTALQEVGSSMEEIVGTHGINRVKEAMNAGMLSEAQLRNYLDYVPVAGISEGAL